MTIRKKHLTAPSAIAIAARSLVLGTVIVGLSGCGMLNSLIGNEKVDYKGAKKAQPLDVPPDLTQLQKDNRYSLPDSKDGIATASSYNAQQKSGAAAAAAGSVSVSADDVAQGENAPVLPLSVADIKVERAGNTRWLVVKRSPEVLWPQLKQFWVESGFTLAVDLPTAGVMETEWYEDRSKIPQDIVRRTLGKVFDSLYSSAERDKYRTRLERLPDGSTEIYISQRGMEEVSKGAQNESTVWMPRPTDPSLEAEYLARLMTKLGGGEPATAKEAKTAVEGAIVQPLHAKLGGAGADRYVEVDEGFDRAWRRVGLALDRAGFTVEDRDRTQGLYFVRYIDPDAVKSEGFFKKLFSFGSSDKDKDAPRFRIVVKGAASTAATTTQVVVQSNEGKPDASPTASKILDLLNEQLK
ncbi:MAG TPA: outer membrane protein assembly factor BamC [Janthinobacterium sp.]|jgi:outer membrane protein assembly factor BamC|nr:outer membrane protein assembly factor BamC [Janthinobacterium sp.]